MSLKLMAHFLLGCHLQSVIKKQLNKLSFELRCEIVSESPSSTVLRNDTVQLFPKSIPVRHTEVKKTVVFLLHGSH